jgi:salicylate hydroxylase
MGKPLRVAVIGGGIGGLTAALALHRRGVDVTVFEQAPELGEVGAGVMIQPNGARILERLGLGEELTRFGARLGEGSTYFRMDGMPVGPILTTDSAGWNGMFGMHRADLLAMLAGALPDGVVRTGHACSRFEQDGTTARLGFANGATVTADAVVAADGIHSGLRNNVTEPAEPVYSGSVAYRGLLSAEKLPDWPVDISQLWMGERKHFLVFPVRSGTLINYVGFIPREREALESWSAPGDPAALAEAFSGWDPEVEKLLSAVESTFWWGLYDREPLVRWTKGRLTLLGDAAHPMLPHVGQGANQAMEDAVVLASLLARAGTGTVGQALTEYESIRRERTKAVQEGSRANGLRYDSAYADLRQRDAELLATATFRRWLYDYDAWAATDPSPA